LPNRARAVQWSDAAEPLHPPDGEVAETNCADLPLGEQRKHRLGGFLDRRERVGPVRLVNVNTVGPKPTQGFVDLFENARAAGVAKNLPTVPFEPDLGCDRHARTQAAFGQALPTISSERPNP
jgi:hypothetical protein